MKGSGVAIRPQTQRPLILADAKVDVAADNKGNGAIHVTSKQAGMARPEHYMKFTAAARKEGHITDATKN